MQFICVTLLIITVFTESRSEQYDVVGPSVPLIAVAGEDAVLPCSIKPSISAVDMRVEWFRLDLKHSPVVHLYEEYEDKITDQLQLYRGRTQLFKDELQTGNTSLKLSRVQISDEGHYKCFVKSRTWYDDTVATVQVEAIGSPPLITIDGFGASGGLQLQCEIKGWNPEPDLVWLDSEGVILRPESTDTHRDTDGFRVKHMITVYSENEYHCRAEMRHHMLETEIIISSKVFNSWRTSLVLILLTVFLSVIAGTLIVVFVYKKKVLYQVLQNLKRSTQNEITLLRKYAAVNVTLDPDSAHPHLTVSPDRKQVRLKNTFPEHEGDEKDSGQNDDKFDIRLGVLGAFERARKFYYEVEVKGLTEWDVGVARKSINRKGWIDLNPNNGYWTVGVRYGCMYQACGDPYVPLSLNVNPRRLGVYVNYRDGCVSFYDVEAMCHIFSFTGQFFDEKLYPFFGFGFGRNDAPLTICSDFNK